MDELELSVDDAFDRDSLDALGEVYADAPDLRRVVSVAGLAVRKTYDDLEAQRVSRPAILAAWAERDTLRGRR